MVESTAWGEPFELVVRDAEDRLRLFQHRRTSIRLRGQRQSLGINKGRLLLSKEFAAALGRPSEAGSVVGKISITANMRPIEITQVVNGEATSSVMPLTEPSAGTVPGPDVIVGDLTGLAQFGSSSGTQVGLAVGTDSCNAGVVPLNWFALPDNDHPVIPQNLYRMSGGATNNDRFEQIGQSNVKHAFTALQQNICGFGCNATGSTTLGFRMLGSLHRQFELGQRRQQSGFARLDQSVYRSLPGRFGSGGSKQPHWPHAHGPFAQDSGGNELT